MSVLSVREVGTAASLAECRTEWNALVASSPDGSFFDTYEWLTSWLESFWHPRKAAFMFVTGDEGMVGFAPWLADDAGDAWCSRSLTLPFHDHVPRGNIVAADGQRHEVLDALLQHVSATRGSMPLIFPQIDTASPLWSDVPAAAERRRRGVLHWDELLVPWIRLDDDWDGYLQTRTSHVRSEMKRKRRKLEKSGRVEYAVTATPRECELALRHIFAIEQRSWKQDEGTSFATEPGVSEFYSTLARRAAEQGWLRLYVMHVDDMPVAHIYGIVYKNAYLALKTSYDQSYRELSPGSVLFEYALRDAVERQYTSFDMLGVEARWKNDLATDVRHLRTACVFSPFSLRCQSCRSYESTVKPYLKEHASWLVSLKRRVAGAPA